MTNAYSKSQKFWANKISSKITQGNWLYLAGFILCTFISQFPIWLVDYPPLSDYPNHLARIHVLMQEKNLGTLANFYQVHWSVLPNLAMDMIVPLLGLFFGIQLAGKIFIATTLLIISSGTFFLHRVLHGGPSIWPFFSFFFLYNALFLYGVVNFLFALGISLWAIALWIWSKNKIFYHKKSFPFRIISLSFISFFIFFCHLSAYAFFSFSIIAYELQANHLAKSIIKEIKYLCILSLALLLPLGVFFITSPTSDISVVEPLDIPLANYIAAMAIRKTLTPLSLISNYHRWFDSLTFLVLGAVLIRGFFSKTLYISRFFSPTLLLLIVGFLLAPFSAFGSHMADTRIFIAFSFLLIASINLKLRSSSTLITGAAALLACLFVFRIGIIANHWLQEAQLTENVLEAVNKLPVGTRHFVSFLREKDQGSYSNSFKRQLPCLAIINRSAFVPAFYSMKGAQPVLLNPEFFKIKERSPGLLSPPDQQINWDQILEDFDFLWIGTEESFDNFPEERLALTEINKNFLIYRVLK